MRNFLKEYFTYSKSERNGVIILLFIIFLLIILPKFFPFFIKKKPYDFESFKNEILEFERQQDSIKQLGQAAIESEDDFFEEEYVLFEFNPNNLPWEKWQELGVRDKTIRTIKNFERKGGRFYRKTDLKKIYGMSPEEYARLEPYIMIPDESYSPDKPEKKESFTAERKKETRFEKPKEEIIIELNTADTVALQRLKGIGPVLSKRIISFRDKLGGFVKPEQLLEIYGMDSLVFSELQQNLLVDVAAVKKLNVNQLSREELSKHPYLNFSVANAIFTYRQQHGNFKSVSDLKKIYIIKADFYEKIAPYIETN